MKKILFVLAVSLSTIVGTKLYGACSEFSIICNYVAGGETPFQVTKSTKTGDFPQGVDMLPQACGTYKGVCKTNEGWSTSTMPSASATGQAARAYCLGLIPPGQAIQLTIAQTTCE